VVTVAKLLAPHGDESLRFAGKVTLPQPTIDALDPIADGVRFILRDTSATILDVTIPGGAYDPVAKVGWTFVRGVFKYRNKAGLQGVVAAKVKPSTTDPGVVILALAGKKGTYAVVPAQLPLTASMALAPGACGEVAFAAPACIHDPVKGKVKCK
jgi:hypothetical protein